jgi:hypothetical protein
LSWAEDKNFEFNSGALNARDEIIRKYIEIIERNLQSMSRYDIHRFASISFEEYDKIYNSSIKENRIIILNKFWEQKKRFSEQQRVDFLKRIIKNDSSLLVVANASKILIENFNLKLYPLQYHDVLNLLK